MTPAIAIDLDGCLAHCDTWVDKHHIGDPYPGAVEAVAAMVAAGYRVIIHTCRTLEADGSPFDDGSTSEEAAATIQAWLAQHGFPEGIEVWTGRGKPFADAYIDDKAVRVAPAVGRQWPMDGRLIEGPDWEAKYHALKREYQALLVRLKGDRLKEEIRGLRAQRRVLAEIVKRVMAREPIDDQEPQQRCRYCLCITTSETGTCALCSAKLNHPSKIETGVGMATGPDKHVVSAVIPNGLAYVYSGAPGSFKLIGRVEGGKFIPEPSP